MDGFSMKFLYYRVLYNIVTAELEKLNDHLEMTCIIYTRHTQKKADIHCDVLPKSKPQQRRSQCLSASTTQTIDHHTAKASRCPFIKYGYPL